MSVSKVRKIFLAMMGAAAVLAVLYLVTRNTMFVFAMIAVLGVSTILSNVFDRCPHCGAYQNFPFHRGDTCYKCGEKLEK